MLQDTIGPGPIDAGVGQRKIVDIADAQRDIVSIGQASASFSQHAGVAINTDDRTVGSDRISQPSQISSRSTPEVNHRVPRPDIKNAREALLVFAANSRGRVHIGDLIWCGSRRVALTHPPTQA